MNFKEGEAHFAAPDAAIAFIRFDNGVWSKLPSGKYVEKTKQQVPEAVRSVNPVSYTHLLFGKNSTLLTHINLQN